jgi:hypothetical protein
MFEGLTLEAMFPVTDYTDQLVRPVQVGYGNYLNPEVCTFVSRDGLVVIPAGARITAASFWDNNFNRTRETYVLHRNIR